MISKKYVNMYMVLTLVGLLSLIAALMIEKYKVILFIIGVVFMIISTYINIKYIRCPHCDTVLNVTKLNTKKCPHCKKHIEVEK